MGPPRVRIFSGEITKKFSLAMLGEFCTGVTSVDVAEVRPRDENRELIVSVAWNGSGYASAVARGY